MAKRNEFPSKGDQKFEFLAREEFWVDFIMV
jgi:hypothetical protein